VADSAPSLVALVAERVLDAELAALVWLLVEADVALVAAVPGGRRGAARSLAAGVLDSVHPGRVGSPRDGAGIVDVDLDRLAAWRLVHGEVPAGTAEARSLEALRNGLAAAPIRLSEQELTFLGCVLILAPVAELEATSRSTGRPGVAAGPLRVAAAHYVRPLARDAHGHAQELPPAVLATWDAGRGAWEHFAWGVLPEIAARLGRRAGDVEADLHHRRDDLGGLAAAGVTSMPEVQRLVAGYRAGYATERH
jgi:hypothetical protein